jgi:TonB-linked SusC/RagA family outer membrane protein
MTASYRFNPMRAIARAALGLLLAASVTEAQQNAVLTGRVTSEAGQALAQAQVFITEMTISVATNDQGVYTITIPAARATGQTVNLRARAIGYAPAVAQVQLNLGSQTRDFTLRRDINRLSEVTVTGSIEGTERAKVPFAIGRVTAEEMPVPSLDPMKALVGKVPGLRVASGGNGRPGSTPQVMLRGPTSLNATGRTTGPLIIVDGTILRVGSLNEVGALDIESVEVVKGAAGASLYGTTAANGVIIIKTKRGNTRDGTTWTARTEYGTSDLSQVHYDAPLGHILQLDETGTRFCVQGSSTASACSRSFNWMDEIQRINGVNADTTRTAQAVQWNAVSNSGGELTNTFQANWWPVRYDAFAQVVTANPFMLNSLDAAGRVGSVRYFVSGQYTTDQGGVKGLTGEQAKRARVNLDYDVRQDWRLSLSTMFANTTTDQRAGGTGGAGIWGQLLRGAPGGTDYLARDTLGRRIIRGGGAPLRGSGNGGGAFLYNMGMTFAERNAERYNAALTTTFTPSDWVTLEGSLAYDTRNRTDDSYFKKGYRTQTVSSANNFGNLSISNLHNSSMNGSLSATVRRELTSDLSGKASVRAQYEREDVRVESGSGQQFVVAEVYTLGNTITNQGVGSSSSSVRSVGVLGGVNLDYKGRYILDMTYRYDGSSLFGAGNRWAPFGRVSAVWIASEEPFWNVPGVSEFRVRASRGTAGNTPRFEAQYETYSCNTAGCSLGQAGNAKLKPETTTEVEVGVDFTVMDRVGIEITNANSSTVDQILNVSTPAILGFTSQWRNAGTLQNKTWELAVNVPIISRADLQWDLRASYDRNRTYITNLVPPDYFNAITAQGTGSAFYFSDDATKNSGFPINRLGNIWGRSFYRSCDELPDFTLSTGGGQTLTCGNALTDDFKIDDRGFVVWTGSGNGLDEGITRNLWQTKLSSANSPWGYPLFYGHPITQRPVAGQPGAGVGSLRIIGNTIPDYRIGFNSTLTWRKLTVYGLFDGTFGHELNNQAEGWGIFDHNAQSMDQTHNTPVGRAKPAGYSWRVGGSEGVGTGGLYDILGPNNYNTETASYLKMRELNVSYRLGPIAGTGDWTVSLLGRNVFTITDYTGMDPETGVQGGQLGSGLLNGVDAFDFPTLRSFTFAISTRF